MPRCTEARCATAIRQVHDDVGIWERLLARVGNNGPHFFVFLEFFLNKFRARYEHGLLNLYFKKIRVLMQYAISVDVPR